MGALWKRLDVSQDIPVFIRQEDEVYYAREYISKGGCKASEANQLIMNFKKPVMRRGQRDWYYKEQAIDRFARELAAAVKENTVIAAIPSSKCQTDPEYDSRLDDTLAAARRYKPSLIIERPIVVKATSVAVHAGGSRRPDEVYSHLVWNGFSREVTQVLLVDDVLTTGSHFRACKRIISEHCPNTKVAGVFWAKTVWPDTQTPTMVL
jgi:predicted amidophosphoribosyltransferase